MTAEVAERQGVAAALPRAQRHRPRKRAIQYSLRSRSTAVPLTDSGDYWIARIGERSDAVLRTATRGQRRLRLRNGMRANSASRSPTSPETSAAAGARRP